MSLKIISSGCICNDPFTIKGLLLNEIVEENSVRLSYSDSWEMTMINLKTGQRRQFSGKTFSEMIGKAFLDFARSKKVFRTRRSK